jgi:hypothetical protein
MARNLFFRSHGWGTENARPKKWIDRKVTQKPVGKPEEKKKDVKKS